MVEPLRIHGQDLRPDTLTGLRGFGFVVEEMAAGPVDAVLIESADPAGPALSSLAMLRLEHPDSLLLLASPAPAPRQLIEWIRAGLDDWIDSAAGLDAIEFGALPEHPL